MAVGFRKGDARVVACVWTDCHGHGHCEGCHLHLCCTPCRYLCRLVLVAILLACLWGEARRSKRRASVIHGWDTHKRLRRTHITHNASERLVVTSLEIERTMDASS